LMCNEQPHPLKTFFNTPHSAYDQNDEIYSTFYTRNLWESDQFQCLSINPKIVLK
jgi:hypothetical protein